MARPRTPKAKAAVTGRDKRDPARFEGRNEPVVAEGVGEPHEWLKDSAKTAWREISAEIPWLNYSHRGHLAIAAQNRLLKKRFSQLLHGYGLGCCDAHLQCDPVSDLKLIEVLLKVHLHLCPPQSWCSGVVVHVADLKDR